MKRTVILFLFFAIAIVISAFHSMQGGLCQTQSGSGPSAGYAGDPAGNGKTCNHPFCHSGPAPVTQTGWITSNIPATGYMPDSIYTITATAYGPGHVKFGFEITPQNNVGSFLGTLIKTSSQTNLTGISSAYITHNSTGTSGTGARSWSFNWKAPAAGSDTVTFYGAFNISNNDSMPIGDTIYTSRLLVPEDKTVGIRANEAVANSVSVFPNPGAGFYKMRSAYPLGQIEIYSAEGKNIFHKNVIENTQQIDLGDQPPGVYFIKVFGKYNKVIKE